MPLARTSVTDSVGVRIVESSARAWDEGQAWTVGDAPMVDLAASGEGEAHEFFQVSDATRLPSGDLAVTLSDEVRFFSARGVHIETVGRKGGGPGEFSRIGGVELSEDSLVVFDSGQRRVTIYGPDRVLRRVLPIGLEFLHPRRFGVLGSDLVVMTASPAFYAAELSFGLVRRPVSIVAISSVSRGADTLAVAAGYESILLERPDGMIDAHAPFGRDSHFSVRGDQIILGEAINFEYHILGSTGALEGIVRASLGLELRSELVEEERSMAAGESPSPEVLRFLDELPLPERRAAYQDLLVDRTGAVWLKEHRGGAVAETSVTPQLWEVFDSAGVWLGRVSVPGRFVVYEIGDDYVLGMRRDEFDVERVQVLPLTR